MQRNLSATKGYLTSSTVFLLLVSLRVSSTKLSQRPLQSSGSSAKAEVFINTDLSVEIVTYLASGLMKYVITFDEVSDLGLYRSFLQVLDHHVGNSGQMTHVASPGATLSPEIGRDTLIITFDLQSNFNAATQLQLSEAICNALMLWHQKQLPISTLQHEAAEVLRCT